MRRTSDWVVTGLGAVVSAIGAMTMRNRHRSRLGSGIVGFGLAHVVLGLVDRALSRNR